MTPKIVSSNKRSPPHWLCPASLFTPPFPSSPVSLPFDLIFSFFCPFFLSFIPCAQTWHLTLKAKITQWQQGWHSHWRWQKTSKPSWTRFLQQVHPPVLLETWNLVLLIWTDSKDYCYSPSACICQKPCVGWRLFLVFPAATKAAWTTFPTQK